MLSYSKKYLKFIFILNESTFTSTGGNTLEVMGFRADTVIDKAGGAQFTTLQAKIFGISLQDMNDITTLMWTKNEVNQNTVEVYAIDSNNEYTTLVFAGDIIQAYPFFNNMPDVYLYVESQSAYYNAIAPLPVTSYSGSVDVASAIQKLATQLGFSFENNGVNIKINNLYAWNSGFEQIKSIVIAAGIDMYVDNNVIAICPPGGARTNSNIKVSKESGMIGYPTFDGLGVDIYVLFNPSLLFGGLITVESDYQRANGTWRITSVTHYLQSEYPNGSWFSMIRGSFYGFAIPT